MANKEHLMALRQGTEAWNAWRKQNPDAQPDLHGALLMETQLAGVYLPKANLAKADFCESNLQGANFAKADLRGSNVDGANLAQADLRETDLQGAQLRPPGLTNSPLT